MSGDFLLLCPKSFALVWQSQCSCDANSLSLAYSFGREAIRSFGAEYLKIILTANDVLRTSTIRREMGTAYPYAHHYSLAVQLTF